MNSCLNMSLRQGPTEALDQNRKTNVLRISNHTTQFHLHLLLLAMLSLAGIDTEKFKAHSTRSTSAAASAGITPNQILEAANWSSKYVFQQLYYKPTSSKYCWSVSAVSCPFKFTINITLMCDLSILKCNYQITEWSPAILDYTKNVR